MKKIYLLVFILACFGNCKNKTDDADRIENSPKHKNDDSALAQRLYADYITNATDQAHIDQNQIIEYAVSHNLDVTRTPSGLYFFIKKQGEGAFLNAAEKLRVDYQGAFLDGKVFDSSYERGEPIEFKIGQMIAGWNEGLTHLKHGSEAVFLIPSRLAYGKKGFPGFVPPNKSLVFDIKVH